MAGPAGLLPVFPFQAVTREGMVKAYITPAGILMADRTLFIGVVLGLQDRRMDVFMAVAACDADLPEFPAVSFPVTVKAGCCQMGPVQDEG